MELAYSSNMTFPYLLICELRYKTRFSYSTVATKQDFKQVIIVPIHMRRHYRLF